MVMLILKNLNLKCVNVKKRIRPLGQVMNKMEPLLLEMTEDHKMQWFEIINIIHGYLQTHCIHSQELYDDNSTPILYYGHKEGLK